MLNAQGEALMAVKKKEAKPAKEKKTAEKKPPSSNKEPGKPEKVVKSTPSRRKNRKDFPTVGIGASAGGLEAFRELLKNLPADTGMAFVLVQHLDPKHESMLTGLIAKATTMPVSEVEQGMRVEPNHVYVIPPNTHMTISRAILALAPRSEAPGQHRPVDHFLTSLAEDRGSRAIGVILSGTASDGTLGLKAIKAEGGITFAQNETAKYDGMPRSAIGSGHVDFILSPERIARELAKIGRHPYVVPIQTLEAQTLPKEGGDNLKRIFRLLLRSRGVDFTYYKHSTIERRIARRMLLRKIEHWEDYVQYLEENPVEVETLFDDMLITLTGFFRDPGAFGALKQKVVPPVTKDRSPERPIRVWVPGCATGEEAYSIAMCLLESLGDTGSNIPIQVFGTDISEKAIEKARSGIYAKNIAEDVSLQRLRRFFVKVDKGYQISKSVRELCIFAKQDLTRDPPFSNLDLISCRNMLIYLGPILQKRVIPLFHYALKSGGFLLLGKSEALSAYGDLFSMVERKHKIYSKRLAPARHFLDVVPMHHPTRRERASREEALPDESRWGEIDIQREADRVVLARHAPPGVVVNDEMEIVQFRGRTGRYLEPEPGEASFNLLKMAREGLKLELRTVVHRAKKEDGPVKKEGLEFRYNGQLREVTVEVVPLKTPPIGERLFLVLFEETTREAVAEVEKPAKKGEKLTKSKKDRRLAQLEQELTSTREYLQSVVEEQEATNEELKSANEEALSSNEELQSINEELETAKEELESANEELTTMNDELQNRNAEMHQLNNDLNNLLASVNIPILMLGNDLRIRRFTPMAEKTVNVTSTDVGRPIYDIKLGVEVPDLEGLISEVRDTVNIMEREVQDRDGHWFSLRVHPYRTIDNKIDGAVLTLVDIDLLKRDQEQIEKSRDLAEQDVKERTAELVRANVELNREIEERERAEDDRRESEERYRVLVETMTDGLAAKDQHGRLTYANKRFCDMLGYSRHEIIGHPISSLVDEADQKTLEEEMARRKKGEEKSYEMVLRRKNGQKVFTIMSPKSVIDADGHFQGSFAVVTDITEHKRAEQEQTRLRRRLEALWGVARLTGTDYDTLCDQILLEIMDMTQSAYAFYGFLNEDESVMSVYAWSRGARESCQMQGKPLEFAIIDAGLWGEAVRERRTIIINDYRADHPRKKGIPEGHVTLTRIVVVPIFSHDHIVALAAVANKPSDYDEEDARQIEGFASNVQVILDRHKMEQSLLQSQKELRLLSSQLLNAEESERKRIAAELHDGIGQSLATIKFGLESGVKTMDKDTAVANVKPLESLIPLLQETIEEVRRIQSDLRPPVLDDLGILATLGWFCREFQKIYSGIRIEKQINLEEKELPDPLKMVVYRVLQESLNNVAKHSKADLVAVSLQKTDDSIELVIEDKGRGFDLKKAISREDTERGLGLATMRERTELSGGSFSIESIMGKGTIVRASWPC
jgi:PAS domain S-box-containing protein